MPRKPAIFCLLMVALAAGPAALAVAQTASVLSARDAHERALAGALILVDVRTPAEWRQTGVPASGHAITLHQNQHALLQELDEATGGSRQKPIALICAVGERSAFLQAWLRKAGFENVHDVAEGVVGGRRGAGWIRSGLPLRRWVPGATKPELGLR